MRHAHLGIILAASLSAGAIGSGAAALAHEDHSPSGGLTASAPPSTGLTASAAPSTGLTASAAPSTTDDGPARAEAFVADVATELGVSPEELDAAVRAVLTDRIETAQAEGRLDAQVADELVAAVSDGTLREVVRGRLADGDRPWQRQWRPLTQPEG